MRKFDLYYLPFSADLRGVVYGLCRYDLKHEKYVVAIDSSLPEEEQKKALAHELAHIKFRHLEDLTKTTDEAEAEADSFAESVTEAELNYLLSFAQKVEVKTA